MDDKILLRTQGLTKIYGDHTEKTIALDGVSLQIPQRKLVALYGPSGSGKTTLLFLLGGLDKPTSGKIYFDNQEVTGMDERRLSSLRRTSFGFVFQNYNLVDDLTISENVMLSMMFDRKSESEMKTRTEQLLQRVGIAAKGYRRPSQLSAGEQQRVAVARALANRPRLILMDEPTGNLDQENSESLMRLIADMIQQEEATCIVATHNPELVRIANSRILLRSGRIVNP